LGVIPFSSPFDLSAIHFLEKINCSMYKIASLETSDHLLIKTAAETGKPIIISTGATTWKEIEELVDVVKQTGNSNLTLLVCTSSYPANPIDSHISRIRTIKEEFDVKVGLSDHTLGIGVSLAAIGVGATVIEKHLTLKRSDGGPDAAFSLEPNEFKNLVEEGNKAFNSLGNSEWSIQNSERESRRLRRSLYITDDVKAGDKITVSNLRAIRPGEGCSPKFLQELLGRKFKKDFEPEIAFFFDIDPKNRDKLKKNLSVKSIFDGFERQGFEENLFKKMTTNNWRLLAHRTPLSEFVSEFGEFSVSNLKSHLIERLKTVFLEEEFVKIITNS
jgi:N-acetylneuraminate synthase